MSGFGISTLSSRPPSNKLVKEQQNLRTQTVIEIQPYEEEVLQVKERKKWNKSTDQVYFKRPSYDEITLDSVRSSPSSTQKDSIKETPKRIGDILIHQSPTNTSIASIEVVEQRSTDSDDVVTDLNLDDDDDDVCTSIPRDSKIISQKSDFSKYSESTETVDETVILNKQYSSGLDKMDEDPTDEDSKDEDSKEEASRSSPEEQLVVEAVEEVKPAVKDDGIVAIVIHKMDKLLMDSLVIHPLVKVHLIDSETGEYVKKSDPKRPVCFYNEGEGIDYITPVLTHAFDLGKQR